MSNIVTGKLRKVITRSLWLGMLFLLVGAGFPASAHTDAQPAQLAAIPANDDFDSPLIVSVLPYSSTQDVIDATTAEDDPVFPCYYGGKKFNTVWYRYSPSASESMVFSTAGSQYGMVVAVWTGARGSLTNQACATAQVELAVSAGTVYFIEIAQASTIIPTPTSMNVVFSAWSANTPPGSFGKSAPANEAAYQTSSPSLTWGKSTYADSYEYCYDTVDNDLCDTSWMPTTATSASLSGLSPATAYYWQVRAANSSAVVTDADDGAWWSFTTLDPADLNHWAGTVSGTTRPVSFDALNDGTRWFNFSVTVPYSSGCTSSGGTSKITIGGPGSITNRSFSYSNQTNSFQFSGAFGSNTTAAGTYMLKGYSVCVWIASPGYCCWQSTSGSGSWTASGPPLLPEQQIFLPLILKD
jgi:hypothetical protein